MPRKYSTYRSMKECAATIIKECVIDGISDGWSGSLEEFEEIEKICDRYNVIYADDFRGSWKPRVMHGNALNEVE